MLIFLNKFFRQVYIREQLMEKHYVDYNFINDEDIYFKELFLLDTFDKTCRICNVIFKRPRNKKNTCFWFHYGKQKQIDGNHNQRTSMLPINVLFFLVRSIIVGHSKHFLCLRAEKKNKFLPNKNVWLNKL